jgi:hypothetical protein
MRARATFQSSVHALEPNGRRAVVMGGLEDRPRSAWLLVPAQTASQHSPAPQLPLDLIYPVPALGAASPQFALTSRHRPQCSLSLFFSMRSRCRRLSPDDDASGDGRCSARRFAQSIAPGQANHHACTFMAAASRSTYEQAYSIISSARETRRGGALSPNVLATFKLIEKMYLVGACTGRSAGLSPFKMRSTYWAERRKMSRVSGP